MKTEKTKKQFIDLRLGDKIWYCSPDSYEEKPVLIVSAIEATDSYLYIKFPQDEKNILFKDPKTRKMEEHSSIAKQKEKGRSYPNTWLYFCNESEYQRYRKAQGMKHLLGLIEAAKSAVNSVKKFRSENFADLNKNWLEEEIIKLEKAIA